MARHGRLRATMRRPLLADAEAPEDLSQQIVCRELARDARQGFLCEPELLREDLPATPLVGCRCQVRRGLSQRMQVSLARNEHRFPCGTPARRGEQRGA